ncbi:MAG: acyl carrier protein [Christensenella sp.]
MTKEQVMQELTAIFRDVFDDDEIILTDATTAEDIEDWDSLEHINIVLQVEKHFKVKFVMSDIKALANVGEMAELVERKVNEQ